MRRTTYWRAGIINGVMLIVYWLNIWMDYIDTVSAIDPSVASDIE